MEMNYGIDTICWNDFIEKDKCVGLDFSVNTNPLGVPAAVTDKFLRQEMVSECYPDPDCNLLVSCLEEKYKVSARYIMMIILLILKSKASIVLFFLLFLSRQI